MNNYTIIDNDLYHDYAYLDGVINRTLAKLNVHSAIFSVIFVTKEEIQRLNRDYRKIDRVTDVISFALEDEPDKIMDLRILGDIYICIDKMLEQAKMYNHSNKRELSFLTVHGLLHLLGYDHQTPEEEKEMFGLQDEILEAEKIVR